ncbi:leucine-rich repeat-containing protein 24 [Prorops nasuta]|uniref:leucine-rich repeat-containing protein 24 n=1 Tax=Prorops nasuta TaxID=863751 RepID=UPI0034CD3129
MELTTARLLLLCWLMTVCRGDADWTQCSLPCKCKWVSGKKTADCVKQNLTEVPNKLSTEIQFLDLTGNKIRDLPQNAFNASRLMNVHKLVMRECNIDTIHRDAFNGLKIVIEIDLSSNNIRSLRPGTFVETQRLRVLLLNNNRLKVLENDLFHDMDFLQKVILSDNRLERIEERTFRNLPELHSLALNGNNLSSLRLQSVEGLPKLGSLELHNNPWNCNCRLKKFRDWTIEKKLYTKPTNCSQPSHLAGKHWDDISSDDFACQPEILSFGPSSRIETDQGDVTLWCRAAGIPRPQLTWLHRSRILSNSTKRHNSDRGYVLRERHDWLNLTIPDVMPSDKGDYVCIAKSPGGTRERNVTLAIVGDALGSQGSLIGLPLAIGLGVAAVFLLVAMMTLCVCYCRRRRTRHDEKSIEAASLERHGLGEQEKSLITAINPVVKPPRRPYDAPSVTSHGTEMTELNRTLLDNDSVFADGGGVGVSCEDEREETPELEGETGTLPRGGTSYRQYPPDLLAFSGGRGSSPTSQASTAPDSTRLPNQHPGPVSYGSPLSQYPAFKTLPHNRSVTPYAPSPAPVMSRHGYVTIPRRPRAPSWSSGPPTSPTEVLEPVYDNLGLRPTADGSSVASLNKSPEPAGFVRRVLPGTPSSNYGTIQRSTPNILASSPFDRAAPEGAPEWPSKLPDEPPELEHPSQQQSSIGATILARKIPPRPPPKPRKKAANGPLYEDEGEDGTEV